MLSKFISQSSSEKQNQWNSFIYAFIAGIASKDYGD